jgi:hypothetical protein
MGKSPFIDTLGISVPFVSLDSTASHIWGGPATILSIPESTRVPELSTMHWDKLQGTRESTWAAGRDSLPGSIREQEVGTKAEGLHQEH